MFVVLDFLQKRSVIFFIRKTRSFKNKDHSLLKLNFQQEIFENMSQYHWFNMNSSGRVGLSLVQRVESQC